MFKIGDFSQLGQISVRMLRHYDKLGLLRPNYTDKWTGYRYYTIDQLPRLNRIVALNDLGLTLQQIADLLNSADEVSAERLRGMLAMRRVAIARELQQAQMQLASVEARLQQIEQEGRPSPYEVVVKSLDPLPVASVRQVVPTAAEMGYYCAALYTTLYARLAGQAVVPVPPEITIYHHTEYTATDLDVEIAAAVAPEVVHTRCKEDSEWLHFQMLPPAELAAALVYEGRYQDVEAAVLALLGWVGMHNHGIAGPLRELHLSGPAHVNGVTQEPAVIELQVPIAPLPLSEQMH